MFSDCKHRNNIYLPQGILLAAVFFYRSDAEQFLFFSVIAGLGLVGGLRNNRNNILPAAVFFSRSDAEQFLFFSVIAGLGLVGGLRNSWPASGLVRIEELADSTVTDWGHRQPRE